MVTGCSFQIEVKIKVAHSICLAIEEKFSMIFWFLVSKVNVILLTAKTFQVKVDTQTFFKVNMHSLTQLDCKNKSQSKVWIHLYQFIIFIAFHMISNHSNKITSPDFFSDPAELLLNQEIWYFGPSFFFFFFKLNMLDSSVRGRLSYEYTFTVN